MQEKLTAVDSFAAMLNAGAHAGDEVEIRGHYNLECHDADGNTLWTDSFDNLVTTVGKGQLMSAALGTAVQGTQTMSLISSVGFTGAPLVTDTMASHSTWFEVDATTHFPSYGTTRPALTFANVNTGTIVSGTASFIFVAGTTGVGTVNGAFISNGTLATNVVGATTGVLFSGGTLAVAQPVVSGNTITASYTLSM